MKANLSQRITQQFARPMFAFFDYVPTRYEATPREKQIRKFIWQFKDGNRTRSLQAAQIVASRIMQKFGSFAEDLVFLCIPASSAEKTEIRYKEFSAEVARLTGCRNGYNAVHVDGSRLAIHESKHGKQIANTETITFDTDFFNGKRVLIFDDVITKGLSYANFAAAIEDLGAEVLGAYFLGRTTAFSNAYNK